MEPAGVGAVERTERMAEVARPSRGWEALSALAAADFNRQAFGVVLTRSLTRALTQQRKDQTIWPGLRRLVHE